MARKREGDAQERVHIWLFSSDWKELKSMYGDTIGPSKFVRLVVRRALRSVQERANGKRQPMDTSSIDTELDELRADGEN
jgi:hypothetical protein